MAPPSPAYDYEHQKLRAKLLPGAYNRPCPRCGELMLKGQALDLGHSVDLAIDPNAKADRIEHAATADCGAGGNRSAGGQLGSQRAKYKPSRNW